MAAPGGGGAFRAKSQHLGLTPPARALPSVVLLLPAFVGAELARTGCPNGRRKRRPYDSFPPHAGRGARSVALWRLRIFCGACASCVTGLFGPMRVWGCLDAFALREISLGKGRREASWRRFGRSTSPWIRWRREDRRRHRLAGRRRRRSRRSRAWNRR